MSKEHHTHFSPNTQLTQARLARGWSQEDVASQIGTEGNTVNRWERGRAKPRPYFRQKLCDLFGKSALELGFITLAQESPAANVSAAPPLESQTPAPFWYVPHLRNPFFTGREEILELLHAALSTDRDAALPQAYALHGLGGVGKTQVALEYAYRHARDYRAVFWIEAETSDSILASLMHIAERLHLPEYKDTDQHCIVSAVHQWLMTQQSQWLLIWDNVENLELLHRSLPPTHQGAILLTTRRQALGTLAHSIELPPMAREEGTQFVLQRAKILGDPLVREQWSHDRQLLSAEQARASELVQMMEGLPLALDQAGAYMEETQCTLEEYLYRYQQQQTRLLERRGESRQDHPASVVTTFSLSFQQMAQKSPEAADLLRVCALLSPDVIPEEVIRQGAVHLGASLQAIATDPWLLDEAVAMLGTYSLIRRNQAMKTLSIHRLVQAVLLGTMTAEERACWLQRIITALHEVFPANEYTTWEQSERLLSHALWCLAHAGSQEETLELSGLASKAAEYLRARGRDAEAEPLFQRAIRILEQAEGAEHQLALSLTGLGFLYLGQGKHAEAEPLFRRAIHLWEQVNALEYYQNAASPDYSLQGLAILFREQGKYAEAEPLFQRVLRIREDALGPEHAQVAYALGSLALLSQRMGKYREAEQQFQRTINIWEQILGSEHPATAEARAGLAYLYYALGRYEEMESLLQQSLHFWEQTLGPDHPQVFYSLIGLARLSALQGQDAQAEQQYQRALRIQEQAINPNDPRVGYLLEDLAWFRHRQGDITEAQELYQRALSFWEQSLGPDHPQVAHALHGFANVFRDHGAYAEAERLYRRCQSIRARMLGLSHLETAETLSDFARCQQAQGNIQDAAILSQQALEIREQILGLDHPETVKNQNQYRCLLETLVEEQRASKMQERSSQEGIDELWDRSLP